MPSRATRVVVDAHDPRALARFWAAALEWSMTSGQAGRPTVSPPADDPAQAGQLPLTFAETTVPKTTKNRIHLDLASRSFEHQTTLVTRLETLGARQLDLGQRNVTWVVMADPEGNEFCVVSHRGSVGKDPASAFGHLTPVAAVVLDCADPEAIAPQWTDTTGWPALGQDDQGVWLRDLTSNGPYLDLHRVPEPADDPLRVRIEAGSADGTAQATEQEFEATNDPADLR